MRIGHGYDAHTLVAGRPLILGGVEVPYDKGLLGHSDADVLAHVVMDAILGALALGSIGHHFPDTDPQYGGVSSMALLAHVIALMKKQGYRLGNLDSVIVAQAPKLNPYIPAMREALAACLEARLDQISVKATTTERMGFEGRQEGMSAHAVVLLTPIACS